MLVAAKPGKTNKQNHGLGASRLEVILDRIDAAWGVTVHIEPKQMAALLVAMFPEHFLGPDMGEKARRMFPPRLPFVTNSAGSGRLTAAQRQEQERRL